MVEKEILGLADLYLVSLRKECEVKSAYLFGSYAKNNANSNSDIDIAVILEEYNDTDGEILRIYKPKRGIDLRIEPHPFSEEEFEEGNPFMDEIKRTGIRII